MKNKKKLRGGTLLEDRIAPVLIGSDLLDGVSDYSYDANNTSSSIDFSDEIPNGSLPDSFTDETVPSAPPGELNIDESTGNEAEIYPANSSLPPDMSKD